MVDIATLGIAVDSTQAKNAAKDLDGLTAAGARAETQTKNLSSETKNLSTLQSNINDVIYKTSSSTSKYADEIRKLRDQMDPTRVAQRNLTDQLAANEKYYKSGAIGFQEYAKANDYARDTASKAFEALENGGKSAGHAATGMAGVTKETIVLGRELARGDFTRMSSSATILAQQLGLVELALSPVGIAITAAAVTVGILTAAFVKGGEEENKFNNMLALSGNYAGLTSTSYEDMAKRIGAATNTSISSNEGLISSLAKTNSFTSQQLESLTTDAQVLAKATGETAASFIKDFDEMSKSPGKFAAEFSDKYNNIITPAQARYIEKLEETEGKQQALEQVIKIATDNIAKNAVENTGYIVSAWNSATSAVSNYWHELINAGKTQSNTDQLRDASEQLSKLKTQWAGIDVNPNSTVGRQMTDLQARVTQMSVIVDNQGKINQKTTEEAQLVRDSDDAYKDLFARYGTGYDSALRYKKDLADLDNKIRLAQKKNNTEELQELVANKAAIIEGIKQQDMPQQYKADTAKTPSNKHAESLARDAESMVVAAQGMLALADAYDKGDASVLAFQSHQKAATEATKKGIDVEAQARRELDLVVAQAAVTGAKAISALNVETTARKAANDAFEAGGVPYAVALKNAEDELKLRPLLAAAANAHGAALVKLNAEIAAYRKSIEAANVEDERTAKNSILDAANKDLDEQIKLLKMVASERATQQKLDQIDQNYWNKYGKHIGQEELDQLKAKLETQQQLAKYDKIKSQAQDAGTNAAQGYAGDVKKSEDQYGIKERDAAYKEIDAMRQADVLSEEEAARAKQMANVKYEEQRLSGAQAFFGALSSLSSSKNKEIAAIGKAAAVIQATIDGVLAVQKALASFPPPWNIAVAAAVGVAAAANVATIMGFEKGGYTGDGGTGDVAGVVHGKEYVFDAQSTSRIGVSTLEALRKGSGYASGGYVGPTPAIANDNGPSGNKMHVEVHNYGSSQIQVEQLGEDRVRIIARDEASKSLQNDGPTMVSNHVKDPNSKVGKAMVESFTVQRRR